MQFFQFILLLIVPTTKRYPGNAKSAIPNNLIYSVQLQPRSYIAKRRNTQNRKNLDQSKIQDVFWVEQKVMNSYRKCANAKQPQVIPPDKKKQPPPPPKKIKTKKVSSRRCDTKRHPQGDDSMPLFPGYCISGTG